MGCSQAKFVEHREILDRATAPGVKFEEHIEQINGENRNVMSWFPENGDIKATVLISHGLGEHALCYYNIAIALVNAGYGVFAIDHVSHGKSDGTKGIIADHKTLYHDFIAFGDAKRGLYPNLPCFIVAHSMGTLVAMMSVMKIKGIQAIVFSGAALFPGHDSASPFGVKCLFPLGQTHFMQNLLGCMASLDPAGPAAPLVVDGISSDEDWLATMPHDPRRSPPVISNRTAYSLLKLVNEVKIATPSLTIPFLCIHGSDDTITRPLGSEYIYRRAGTDISHRKYKLMHGCRHECFHEKAPKDQQSIQEVVDYLNQEYETHRGELVTSAGGDGEEKTAI